MFPIASGLPTVTTEQMIEVDRIMVQDLSIDLPRMMENAGRSLAALAIDLFSPTSVTVLAGSGGNGGGALVAARHLANRGVAVFVTPTRMAAHMSPVAAQQAEILERMGIPMQAAPRDADLIVDGLIGYSLSGPPRGRALELIEWSNGRRTISLDVPSGVDSTSGAVPGAAVRAEATMTLALPKTGIVGHPNAGRLFLADISVPPSVYSAFDIALETPFRDGQIVEIG
ncbi:MAG TPA: NAD(P)H-hydrate epimerase [Acidimicrobiia bacterium]